ncbi:glycoside hydrolase family 2 TIM barrel-domain containing protein [uncultured Mucilaginibacter sp.]|uniref:glycoside hydrolase family 2 TIM barrel-domain containing protein n=1 Tax=uncultured Mucilaginibacter sp. TaxID=797541 RepID=UPI0025EEF646|nr:glycoside hydrolase family 2 TIM barrel-domain containing protein [uncultured Mucilaginibacter sp.]
MIKYLKRISAGLLVLTACTANAQTRQTILFDKTWSFEQSDATGADKVNFDDSKWKVLDVPHDWSILGPFNQNNTTGRGGGYLPAGIGWYRKHFTLNDADAPKRVFIYFDGVMANSDVWINGYHLGKRPYGYISFEYEMTGHLNFGRGKTNVLSVRADNSIQPASRYYTGAGIYRHVHLIITDPVHIDNWGVFVTTPQVSADKATVHVKTTVFNATHDAKTVTVQTVLVSPDGKTGPVADSKPVSVESGKTTTVEQDIAVSKPDLWDVNHPALYKAISNIKTDKVVDEQITTFGIRDAKFTADQGFVLNGKKVMIKGVCLHHDGGAVGAAVPLRVWERRLQLLKDIGVNGIRTSHNPVAPEFLDLCDKMGFLVMDENLDTWEAAKQHAENGYGRLFKEWGIIDTRDQVLRDRNHPSVVIYSVGNEIHDGLNDSTGFRKYADLQNTIHQYDGTRPVTMALFRPNVSKVYSNGFVEKMDVVGQNYRENELTAEHEAHPNLKVIGTENGHTQQAWLALRDHQYMSGQFLWTGIDYLGEADWPNVVNGQGLLDHTGGTRPLAMQRESWWSDKPVVHIVRKQENAGVGPVVADWTPADFDTYDDARVLIYTNCDEVELFLNDKSLGVKPKNANDQPVDFTVTYAKGTIRAVGRNKGKEVTSEELKTAGEPAKIVLSADKGSIANSWDDVSYVTATVVDANGVPCPLADKILTFSATGAGVVAFTDNADLGTQETFTSPVRHSYHGKAIGVIKANAASGTITVKVTSPGLADGNLTINVK